MKKHYRHENDCLNCGTVLEGKFCHNCGQENLQIKENFGHLMNHAISDYFHFDHQFFHTLKPLLFKPGKLTNEYMAGKRVQYLHPIKMYIFISLVFFVLYFKNTKTEDIIQDDKKPVNKEALAKARKTIESNKYLDKTTKKSLDSVITKANAAPPLEINTHDDEADADEKDDGSVKVGNINLTDTDYPTYEKYLAAQSKLPADERDNYFERLLTKKKFDYKKHGGNPKELLMEEFKHNIPKMMFVLLPLFALILRLTFWKNRKYYVEHLIYSFHLHCFLFLFLGIVILLKMILPADKTIFGWIDFVTFIGIVLYIYKSLKAVYHRSRWRTISKMIGMSFSYFFVSVVCICLVLIISAITAA